MVELFALMAEIYDEVSFNYRAASFPIFVNLRPRTPLLEKLWMI